jgi:diguanylate cyclase (GGDEF)-like protein
MPIRRWLSSEIFSSRLLGKIEWWFLLTAISAFLVWISPVGSPFSKTSPANLSLLAHLLCALILWSWINRGPGWGIATTAWSALVVGFVALASRQYHLYWLLPVFGAVAWISELGREKWDGILSACSVEVERLEAEINTSQEEMRRLREADEGFNTRLQRYQQLRQAANTFSASLPLADLIHQITGVTGDLIHNAELVLLYLVDPKSLSLELKSVWRRNGNIPIKHKTGDPFDHWVMRQAQPLLIEDPSKDFRFPESSAKQIERKLGSLIGVPLLTRNSILGVLRAESPRTGVLHPDDLRLVRIIGDLAALGIENSRLYSQMVEFAITDDLTKLSVRRYFERRLDEELARARQLNKPLSVLLIDIDRFKDYNDTFGHSAGDKLLKYLSLLMAQARRPGEVAARFGGEEFAWLMPGVGGVEAAARAEDYRRQVQMARVELRRSLTQATVSIGVAEFPRDGDTREALLRRADERMYKAKESGRNRVVNA